MNTYWETATELQRRGIPFVVVTLLDSRGHAPQDKGAKAVVTADRLECGTVGGGKVEARAIQRAQEILAGTGYAGPQIQIWNLQRDIGMTCGGEVTYLFEKFSVDWQIAVFGAGHVAQALVPLLQALPCAVTCIDPREEWVSRLPKGPNVRAICHSEPAQLVPGFSSKTFFVCVSQGHAHDLPVLAEIFRLFPEAVYVGAIGSEAKSLRLRSDLLAKGVKADLLERLRCPIGLRVGSNHPAEIAVSIAAQLLEVRDRIQRI